MDALEEELAKCISDITCTIEKISTLDAIMEKVVEISRYKRNSTDTEDMEEYYIEQINRWMSFSEEKAQEAAQKEEQSKEKEKKYLLSLKRIKELEKANTDIQSKYEYYKEQLYPN
ncbi:hypothetical protein NECID01_0766 [Nematocida sp. AWRm77]|nr:hypothetical protein NECID01_0766 [Nematocida sp. AWRm77]